MTICQINALRAARNAGLFVPKETVENVHPVRQAVAEPRRRLPLHASRRRQRLSPLGRRHRRLAVGGRVRRARRSTTALSYLKQFIPEIKFGSRYSHYFYGHYYAAQAMWIRGGDDWMKWYPAIRDELLHKRSAQGYWHDSHLQRIRHRHGADHPSDAQ